MDNEDMFKQFAEMMYYSHLYKVHPHFDKYPQYMKDALIANEQMQGRVPKTV